MPSQRDRGVHICVCGFIGATAERKAASGGILFGNTSGKLVKGLIFACSRLSLHAQRQQTLELPAWCVHELCSEQAAGAGGVCVSELSQSRLSSSTSVFVNI